MPPVFLNQPFLDMASNVWAMPEEYWIDDAPILKDTELLEKEARDGSEIDKRNLRSEMIQKWKAGEVNLYVKELPGRTRLLFLGTQKQLKDVPWKIWARIFQAIAHPIGYTLFYAHPLKREFPTSVDEQISAIHINAGYSYLCQQTRVVIYRFEEATRVLLHELLHTACFDKGLHVTHLEASTEAWTEVLLCAILSKGVEGKFNKLWKQQCSWIKAQTDILKQQYNVTMPEDYAWRYLVGKEEKLRLMDLLVDCKPYKGTIGLRFTTPDWDVELYV